MVEMKYIEEMIDEVKEQLHTKINHPFFNAHIDHVEINEAELGMLIVILQEMELLEEQILHYATTIMLIQIALDTHEKVTDAADSSRVHKQLTVLAGDYFSGWYYYLLAENEDIKLIGELAIGIKEINENKIRLYSDDYVNFEEAMSLVEKIEMGLVKKAIDYFYKEIDVKAISKMFLLNRLNDEQKIIAQTGVPSVLKYITDIQDNNELIKLAQYMEQLHSQIQGEIVNNKSLQYMYETYIR